MYINQFKSYLSLLLLLQIFNIPYSINTASSYANFNKLENPNFIYPIIPGYSQELQSLPSWESKSIEIGIGSAYNDNWGNRYVLSLAGSNSSNGFIKQTLDLKFGVYNLNFEYAAREGHFSSSGLSLFWNGKEIKRIQPTDESVRSVSILLVAKNGKNSIEFRGVGKIDPYAMSISGLQLKPTFIFLVQRSNGSIAYPALETGQNESLIVVPYTENSLNNKTLEAKGNIPEIYLDLIKSSTYVKVPTDVASGIYNSQVFVRGGLIPVDFEEFMEQANVKNLLNTPINGVLPPNAVGLALQTNWRSNSPTNSPDNIILNGNFILPRINNFTKALRTLNDWQISSVELGTGWLYNENWGNRFVIKLGTPFKSTGWLKQTFNLRTGRYLLSLNYALDEESLNEASLEIVWNGISIQTFTISSEDKSIKVLSLELEGTSGENSLEIVAVSDGNGYAIGINDVRLVPIKISENLNPLGGNTFNTFNLRQTPALTPQLIPYIPSITILETNPTTTTYPITIMTKTLNLPAGNYSLSFSYKRSSPTTSPIDLVLNINNKQVDQLSSPLTKEQIYMVSLQVSRSGTFTIEVRANGKEGDVILDKLMLITVASINLFGRVVYI